MLIAAPLPDVTLVFALFVTLSFPVLRLLSIMVKVTPLLIFMPLESLPVAAGKLIVRVQPARSRVRSRSMVSWVAPTISSVSMILPLPPAPAAVYNSS